MTVINVTISHKTEVDLIKLYSVKNVSYPDICKVYTTYETIERESSARITFYTLRRILLCSAGIYILWLIANISKFMINVVYNTIFHILHTGRVVNRCSVWTDVVPYIVGQLYFILIMAAPDLSRSRYNNMCWDNMTVPI